jgi:hypothetical protein
VLSRGRRMQRNEQWTSRDENSPKGTLDSAIGDVIPRTIRAQHRAVRRRMAEAACQRRCDRVSRAALPR